MGQKISAVHGVRSENYYEPGNAVNEVWIGDLEIISRLPFGDSDMAQAAWPAGDWPKIPWRPFIIPLKQNAIEARSADVDVDCEDKACACLQWGGAFSSISPEASFTVALCLCFIIILTYGVPIKLADITRRTAGGIEDVAARKRWCRDRVIIGFGCLIVGAILTVLDCEALAATQFCREPTDAAIISRVPAWWLFNWVWGIVVALMNVLCVRQVIKFSREYIDLRWPKGGSNLPSTGPGPGISSRPAPGVNRTVDDSSTSYELDRLQFSGTVRTLDQLSLSVQQPSRTTTNKGPGIPDPGANNENLPKGHPEK